MSEQLVIQYKVIVDKKYLKSPFVFGFAEKPTAAKKIASILDSKSKKIAINVIRKTGKEKKELPTTEAYFVQHNSQTVIIIPAFGHLFTLVQDGIGWQYPVYDFKWEPLHQSSSKNTDDKFMMRIESAIESIRYVASKAKEYVVMTDYDEEGEVIGGVTLSKILGERKLNSVKRMKFSTFAKKEILHAYNVLFEEDGHGLDLGMYNKGLMRHYLDWIWGINLSRALMLSLKNSSGKYHTLSTGRVQGPTLSFVAEREFDRKSFVPVPYFDLDVKLLHKTGKLELNNDLGSIESQQKAKSIRTKLSNQHATVTEITKKKSKSSPPVPYNLSSLQKDAYQYYKINPSRTLQVAEKLYLAACISYPRTSSEQYPSDIDHNEIIGKLVRQQTFKELKSMIPDISTPIMGKKTDPAHPCIYPTGIAPKGISKQDRRIYDLIVFRYFAGFGTPAVLESNKVIFDINGYVFSLNGRRTVEMGWKALAGILGQTKDLEIPTFRKGSTHEISSPKVLTKYTRGPPSFNQASLLRMMESQEIGTKATRSEIIKNIIERKYLSNEPLELSPVGEIVNEVLQKYSPQVISVELSRQMEKMGDLIEASYNDQNESFTLQDAITHGIIHLHEMLKDLKLNEQEVGCLIDTQLSHLRKEEVIIGKCISCKTGDLKIIRSQTSGKRFIGCSNYFENRSCEITYPLPQKGKLIPLDSPCKADNYPQIRVFGGKKPWILCLNPDCELREDFKLKATGKKKTTRRSKK
ncbi:MAG: DNA topoisomerase I [Candidatus Heimdallarchaeota archaeon]|nr:DNA topoisomerase I [Candidatus Heimdallarchaeota archaeon]